MKNLLVVQLFLKVNLYRVVRGAWRTAHVDTTSSTGRESVRLPTLGIIHLDASPSVFQRAGRYKDFIFGLEGNLFIEVLFP